MASCTKMASRSRKTYCTSDKPAGNLSRGLSCMSITLGGESQAAVSACNIRPGFFATLFHFLFLGFVIILIDAYWSHPLTMVDSSPVQTQCTLFETPTSSDLEKASLAARPSIATTTETCNTGAATRKRNIFVRSLIKLCSSLNHGRIRFFGSNGDSGPTRIPCIRSCMLLVVPLSMNSWPL